MKNVLGWIGKIAVLLAAICLLSLRCQEVEEKHLDKINQDIASLTATTPEAHYQKTMLELLSQKRALENNLESIKEGFFQKVFRVVGGENDAPRR